MFSKSINVASTLELEYGHDAAIFCYSFLFWLNMCDAAAPRKV